MLQNGSNFNRNRKYHESDSSFSVGMHTCVRVHVYVCVCIFSGGHCLCWAVLQWPDGTKLQLTSFSPFRYHRRTRGEAEEEEDCCYSCQSVWMCMCEREKTVCFCFWGRVCVRENVCLHIKVKDLQVHASPLRSTAWPSVSLSTLWTSKLPTCAYRVGRTWNSPYSHNCQSKRVKEVRLLTTDKSCTSPLFKTSEQWNRKQKWCFLNSGGPLLLVDFWYSGTSLL